MEYFASRARSRFERVRNQALFPGASESFAAHEVGLSVIGDTSGTAADFKRTLDLSD